MNTQPRILVIDDDTTVCKSVERVLNNKGFDVDVAFNGHDGMAKFSSDKHDVVITDIMMPDINGMDIVEFVKHVNPNTSVSVITGFGSNENKIRANELNVTHFIEKPLSPQMIEDIVENVKVETITEATVEENEVVEENIEELPKGGILKVLKNITLFFASPFIALGYIIALPFVGFYMAAKLAKEVLKEKK